MTIISFIAVVSLSSAFIFNTFIKWGSYEKIQVYSPKWLPIDCIFCLTFWLNLLIGLVLILSYGLPWEYLIYAAISQQITIQLIRY